MTDAAPTRQDDERRRDVTINLRATSRVRDLIDRAAALLGKSRSEFMLDSARRCAEDVLLDQSLFLVSDEKFASFLSILDAPPKPTQELRTLLATKAPWEA
jgi:uncharacterized protein (DUF1778 family)